MERIVEHGASEDGSWTVAKRRRHGRHWLEQCAHERLARASLAAVAHQHRRPVDGEALEVKVTDLSLHLTLKHRRSVCRRVLVYAQLRFHPFTAGV